MSDRAPGGPVQPIGTVRHRVGDLDGWASCRCASRRAGRRGPGRVVATALSCTRRSRWAQPRVRRGMPALPRARSPPTWPPSIPEQAGSSRAPPGSRASDRRDVDWMWSGAASRWPRDGRRLPPGRLTQPTLQAGREALVAASGRRRHDRNDPKSLGDGRCSVRRRADVPPRPALHPAAQDQPGPPAYGPRSPGRGATPAASSLAGTMRRNPTSLRISLRPWSVASSRRHPARDRRLAWSAPPAPSATVADLAPHADRGLHAAPGHPPRGAGRRRITKTTSAERIVHPRSLLPTHHRVGRPRHPTRSLVFSGT